MKHEIRMSKSETKSNLEIQMCRSEPIELSLNRRGLYAGAEVSVIRIWSDLDLFRISSFGFRI